MMIDYTKELNALKHANRYRQRKVYNDEIYDFASNDYLCLSSNKKLIEEAYEKLQKYKFHSAKASMLVNGYHQAHADFERDLCEANGFEDGIVMGSGFNANIALIESLVRKTDELFIDEKYHASGLLATKLIDSRVTYFKHNSSVDLEEKIKKSTAKRKIVAVEGVYSMDGDIVNVDIIHIANRYEALLILDEAHSSGVIGKKLTGIFEFYNLPIKQNYIKMGTLGKAYGGFGAYILASSHIVDFLINRAKPIIYATAPSIFETLLGRVSLAYIRENSFELHKQIKKNQDIIYSLLGVKIDALIVPIDIGDDEKVLQIQERLLQENFLVGAIRKPTVDSAIIRLIARLSQDSEPLSKLCTMIKAHID